MDSSSVVLPILPGYGLGTISLGASLRGVLTMLRSADETPFIDITFDQTDPLTRPVIVELPQNGLRLRFDGPDQRLRLIEVMSFNKSRLTYKASELVKERDTYSVTGPTFKRIYQIFGASFPGVYRKPSAGAYTGTYVLSYDGVAFTFPIQHAAWSKDKDHVALLSSQAVGPALHMAIFEGRSWEEARKDLFTRRPANPRSLYMAARPKDLLADEIEYAVITGAPCVELSRREPAPPFVITLNQTTPQDLITELGAPDATHKRNLGIHIEEKIVHRRGSSITKATPNGRQSASQPSSYSSTATDTYDSNFDNEDLDTNMMDRARREVFWCYFDHGMDILVGPSMPQETQDDEHVNGTIGTDPHLVVLKVVLHGNVPGTYAFNRHRRLRWELDLGAGVRGLTSEMNFEDSLKAKLLAHYSRVRPVQEMARGKVINRTWAGDASDSSFFLPDAYDDLVDDGGSEEFLGNTKLYQFPRLAFEVTERGAISAITVG